MLRTSVIASLAACMLACTVSAKAADLHALPAPAPVAPVAYNWTGFYLGVNVGYGYDHFAFPYGFSSPSGYVSSRSAIDSSGVVAGGQVGFNYEFPCKVILGVELDDQWAGIRGQTTTNVGIASATFGTSFRDFGTGRLRIGYALDGVSFAGFNFDRMMVYFTGGFTFGQVTTYANANNGAGYAIAGSSHVTRSGLVPHVGVVGIGGEYALTENLSIKSEYLYEFINAHYERYTDGNGAFVGFNTRTMYHVSRVGLNYRFDMAPSPTPVVAKY